MTIEVKFTAKRAMFTDPIYKLGGEKTSYAIPTYGALRGMMESIYWKPTFNWVIDECRIMNEYQTEPINIKNASHTGCSLNIYNYLSNVEYRVKAHFEWNPQRPDLTMDRNFEKHISMATRYLEKGGRRDIYFGTRECQGRAYPYSFDADTGAYDDTPTLPMGLMVHSTSRGLFDKNGNRDLNGTNGEYIHFWNTSLDHGIIRFPKPHQCTINRKL